MISLYIRRERQRKAQQIAMERKKRLKEREERLKMEREEQKRQEKEREEVK